MAKLLSLGAIAFILGLGLGATNILTSHNITVSAPEPLTNSQPTPGADKNQQRFEVLIAQAKTINLSRESMSEIIAVLAQKFLGAKYQANLLDKSTDEKLVITLDSFDCIIYVETVLALARQISLNDYKFSTFADNLVNERYLNGEINGYCSRLHYFSDWLEDNQRRRIIDNITGNLGGIPLTKTLNFMTSNRDKYPQLSDDNNYQCILTREKQVNQLPKFYIPTQNIKKVYNKIQAGDIIAIATAIPGLDVTHTGLAIRNADGSIGIIHASPGGEVVIAKDLKTYAAKIDQAIGIMVARPLDPRLTKN